MQLQWTAERPRAEEDEPETAKPSKEGKPEENPRAAFEERLLKTRTVQLFGPVDDKLAARITTELLILEADKPGEPITMLLNSPGGSVTAGFAIYDVMRFVESPIRIVCTGLTASIATVILLGTPKALRLSLPNTRLLIHQPLIPMTVYGPASDLEITANEILKTRARVNQLLASETGQPLERIENDTHRDYWLTAEEAVTYGLVARIIRKKSELDASV